MGVARNSTNFPARISGAEPSERSGNLRPHELNLIMLGKQPESVHFAEKVMQRVEDAQIC